MVVPEVKGESQETKHRNIEERLLKPMEMIMIIF